MVILLMVLIVFLGYKLLRAKQHNEKNDNQPFKIHDEALKRLEGLPLTDTKLAKSTRLKIDPTLTPVAIKEEFYCLNHPEEMSSGVCDICEKAFCAHCLKNHKNLHFCPEHLQIFLSAKWDIVTTVKTNPDETTEGVRLYHIKHDLWKDGIPSYLETQYKINIENDFIESFVALYARENDIETAKSRL